MTKWGQSLYLSQSVIALVLGLIYSSIADYGNTRKTTFLFIKIYTYFKHNNQVDSEYELENNKVNLYLYNHHYDLNKRGRLNRVVLIVNIVQ